MQLKTSAITGGAYDISANYSGKFGPVKVRARAGYTETSVTDASRNFIVSGSVSALHDSGLLATFAVGKENYAGAGSKSSDNHAQGGGADLSVDTNFNGTEDPHFVYFGVGYNAKIFGAGQTAFYFKWNQTEDAIRVANHDENEGESVGFAIVQKFSAIGAQIGLEYMNYSYESKSNTTDNTFDDIDVIALMTVFAF